MSEEEGIQEMSPEVEEVEVEETEESKSASYHERIQSDPEFAVGEVQKKDRYIGELHAHRKKFEPLAQYVEAAGGEEIARLVLLGNQVDTNPAVKKAVQDALNGVTPQPSKVEEEEEEIFDPEIKALRSRYDTKIEALMAQNQDLANRLNQTEATTLRGSLQTNVETALAAFADDPEVLEEAQGEITRAVKSLETAASQGDKSAAEQLRQLGTTQGSQTLEMMTIRAMKKYYSKKLEGKSTKPNGEAMRSKATDAPSTTRAAMPRDEITVKPGRRVTSQLIEEVMIAATRKLGKDPDAVFRH